MRRSRNEPRIIGSTSEQTTIQDEGPNISETPVQGAAVSSQSDIVTQPTIGDDLSERSTGTPLAQNQRVHQDVLVECNTLVKRYRKGEISKATVYVEIQSKLVKALGDDRDRTDAAFGSFIATIKSHDSDLDMAAKRAGKTSTRECSSSPAVSDADEQRSDDEPISKKAKFNESEYAWITEKKEGHISLSQNLTKTLKLLDIYTVDPKTAKRSLTNQHDCPEFPDSEWKNIISGRAVNLDAVLSGQLSTTNEDLKIEKFGDIEVSFGAVEPTKFIKNGGDWLIAWNRTVRATVFAFPHSIHELTNYGEYIINLFSVTHPSVHGQVIAFDKATRKHVGSVRNLELSDFEKFADLKIAHMDSIGVAISSGLSKIERSKGNKRSRNWKRDEACNKWNDGTCHQEEESC